MQSLPAAERPSSMDLSVTGRSLSWPVTARVALLSLLFLGACSSGPAPRLYVLEPIVGNTGALSAEGIDALGVATVKLPGYARDTRIASRNDGNRLTLNDGHRWAEAPEGAITRVFAERLRLHAGATVLIEPYPRGYAPDARVEINFDRLLRESTGGVDMAGQIILLAGDGRGVLGVKPFRLLRSGESTERDAFMVAVSEAIDQLARLTVGTLVEAN